MAKIDAHQQFWQFDPVRDAWITPDMTAIWRDFLPPDLQPLLAQHDLDGCVAVQASQTEAETDWFLSLANVHDFIKGVVGWVDLRAANIHKRLAHYSRFTKLKGFRHVLQGEADRALMLGSEFQHSFIAQLSASEQARFWGDTATAFYQL